MEYTEEQARGFKEEYSKRRKRQLLATLPIVLVMLAVSLGGRGRPDELFGLPAAVWGPLLAAVFVGALAFAFKNWRCPACNRSLGKNWALRFCPKCGVGLA